jgi:copper(I)-binding protein
MSMEMQDAVQIPGRDQVEFKPGGLHVMLVDINRDLTIGDTISLTLHFQTAGDVTIDVSVEEP